MCSPFSFLTASEKIFLSLEYYPDEIWFRLDLFDDKGWQLSILAELIE